MIQTRLVKVALGGGTGVTHHYFFGDLDGPEYASFLAYVSHLRSELALRLDVTAFRVPIDIKSFDAETTMSMRLEDFPNIPLKLITKVLMVWSDNG